MCIRDRVSISRARDADQRDLPPSPGRAAGSPRPAQPARWGTTGIRGAGDGMSAMLQRWIWPFLLLGVFLVTWEIVVVVTDTPTWMLPKPTEVFTAFREDRQLLWRHTQVTLLEVVIGFGVALLRGERLDPVPAREAAGGVTVDLFRCPDRHRGERDRGGVRRAGRRE